MMRRTRKKAPAAGRGPMFLVALSSSGKGQSACVDKGFAAKDFRREHAKRKIVCVPGPQMAELMGFRKGAPTQERG